VLAGRLAGVAVIGYADKPGKAQALADVQAAAVTNDLAEITTALRDAPRVARAGPSHSEATDQPGSVVRQQLPHEPSSSHSPGIRRLRRRQGKSRKPQPQSPRAPSPSTAAMKPSGSTRLKISELTSTLRKTVLSCRGR
jgi:hypothetical protein